jgi:high-affinity nickel-transport protein
LSVSLQGVEMGDGRRVVAPQSRTATGLFGGLLGANLLAWAWAFSVFHDRPALLGIAMLAWVFGLRHAMDADHLAAIDNVVRKLMQEGRGAQDVGLWFSLGHSTVVILASAAVAASAVAVHGWLGPAGRMGEVAGTLVSAGFLLAIAATNLVVLGSVWKTLRRARSGGRADDAALDEMLAGRGLLARLLRPVFSAISRSWQMYPLGFLFGLGFDTATEIGVLGISATQAVRGMSSWQAMVFPALFTAGMAMVDTTDSFLMVRAYGWAFVDPLRKLWYNLTMTTVSVAAALLIGGVEVLGLLSSRLSSLGPFWKAVNRLSGGLDSAGFAVAGVFAVCWLGSVVVQRGRSRIARE